MRALLAFLIVLTAGVVGNAAIAKSPAGASTTQLAAQGMQLELQKPFNTRSPWRLIVSEGPPTKDYGDNDAPGALTLYLQTGPSGDCLKEPVTPSLRPATPDDPAAWEPHYLRTAKVVYLDGQSAAPLLLLVTGSLHAANGDQIVYTELLAYDSSSDAFARVYENRTGQNNNQETRFITDGPLRGSVISAEPQQGAPFGYWIVVSKRSGGGAYRQALRFVSATRYGDGNPLAVIDAEMPTIQQRLGLWKPGQPLPTPTDRDKPCTRPALKRSALLVRVSSQCTLVFFSIRLASAVSKPRTADRRPRYSGVRFAYEATSHLLPAPSKLTCSRAWPPLPSALITTPSPKLGWLTRWPSFTGSSSCNEADG